jgi:RNA polymerase sigma-70 factor (ECF subfamily)
MDADEFDAFYATTARRLVGQLTAMTGDWAEAQDCVQEAYVRAWRHRSGLAAARNPEAWVRTTAWRLSVSRWRRATSALRAHQRHGGSADLAGPGPDHIDLMRALRGINPEQRRAIVLHHLCDLSVDEVARETGATPGTVKSRLARGRAALAPLLVERVESPSAPEGKSHD